MTIWINGQAVPPQAVDYELQRLVRFYREHLPNERVEQNMKVLRARAVEQAIGAKLLMDEARRVGIDVDEEEVDRKLEQMVARCGGRESFTGMLAKQNLTQEELRGSIRNGARVDRLVERVTAEVPEPKESEIQTYYREHRGDYVTAPRVQARHILMRKESRSTADRATARSRLTDMKRRVEDGADFGNLAAAHSECPSGKRAGGSLGWVARGTLVSEFEEALFELEVGGVSDVVETDLGLHIVQKTGEEPSGTTPLAEVHDRIRELLRHSRRGEALSAYVDELRAKALIQFDDRESSRAGKPDG
jgi:parvulin-like peptidyl-prolyl isomerase